MRLAIAAAPLAAPFAALLAATVAVPAAAQPPVDWSRAVPVRIDLVDNKFIPDRIQLRRNRPYRFVVHNGGGKTHDLTAPGFWTDATIPPGDDAKLAGTRLKLGAGETQTVRLVPHRSAIYKFHSSTFGDDVLGFKGIIDVR